MGVAVGLPGGFPRRPEWLSGECLSGEPPAAVQVPPGEAELSATPNLLQPHAHMRRRTRLGC